MTRDFFDPPWEETNVVLVDSATLRKAERLVVGCERWSPDDAELPFDGMAQRFANGFDGNAVVDAVEEALDDHVHRLKLSQSLGHVVPLFGFLGQAGEQVGNAPPWLTIRQRVDHRLPWQRSRFA